MSVATLRQRIELSRALPPPAERRQLRESAGASLREIAEAVGVTPSAVAFWERGERCPRGEHLKAYVDVLHLLRETST